VLTQRPLNIRFVAANSPRPRARPAAHGGSSMSLNPLCRGQLAETTEVKAPTISPVSIRCVAARSQRLPPSCLQPRHLRPRISIRCVAARSQRRRQVERCWQIRSQSAVSRPDRRDSPPVKPSAKWNFSSHFHISAPPDNIFDLTLPFLFSFSPVSILFQAVTGFSNRDTPTRLGFAVCNIHRFSAAGPM